MIKSSSAFVMPFDTSAEYPPMKLTRSKTISHLYTADRLKGRLVRKIRLAHDLKYSAMNDRVYKYCATQIGILGAYIGGLINKAQKEKKSK